MNQYFKPSSNLKRADIQSADLHNKSLFLHYLVTQRPSGGKKRGPILFLPLSSLPWHIGNEASKEMGEQSQ